MNILGDPLKNLPQEATAVLDRVDISVAKFLSGLDDLLTKHEGKLKGLRVVISIEEQTPNP